MTKYYRIPKPYIVDAVQFKAKGKFPESASFQIHPMNNQFVLVTNTGQQLIISDKDWIITQSNGEAYHVPKSIFESDFKKVIEVKMKKTTNAV
jgi:hypothetical protein